MHNRVVRAAAEVDENYPTRTDLDIQGRQRSVRDALDRPVVTGEFDLFGNQLHEASMDAGERWTLNNAVGRPVRGWTSRGIDRRLTYDAAQRPTGLYLTSEGHERQAERTVYGENQGAADNLRGRVYQAYDDAGVITERFV